MVFSSGTIAEVSILVSLAKYTIVMWYGTIANIPTGWQICDGTNGTPDLRGYFVRGAADGVEASNTIWGVANHTHVLDITNGLATASGTGATRTGSHTHPISDADNEPLHKRLIFIMKL